MRVSFLQQPAETTETKEEVKADKPKTNLWAKWFAARKEKVVKEVKARSPKSPKKKKEEKKKEEDKKEEEKKEEKKEEVCRFSEYSSF